MKQLTVTTATSAVPVITAGPDDGELVLLLHGFPQNPRAFAMVQRGLANQGLRTVAPWLPGYRPDFRGPRRAVEATAVAELFVELADALGVDRFHVVGHDWGAVVAWALGARHGQRVSSLTALSVPHPRAILDALPSTQSARLLYAGFFQVPFVPERVLSAAGGTPLRLMMQSTGLAYETATEYVDALTRNQLVGDVLNWYRVNGINTVRKIGPVDVPTQLLWGRRDPAITRRAAEGAGRYVTGPYRFEDVDEGHWLPELAADLVVDRVLSHISVSV